MKVTTVMSGVLAIVLWSGVFELFAQQPQIDVTMDHSLEITQPYDDVIKLSNGNLQFYSIAANNGSLQVTGFQYISREDSLTETVQLGNITNIAGEIQRGFVLQRFGYFYAVYQFTGSDPQGLIIMRLDGNELMYRLIDNIQININFVAERRMDFTTENTAAIAMDDSLIYYNLLEGTSQTLLEGEVYQCDYPLEKRVYAMPDGHFAYIKDSNDGQQSEIETWIIYNSEGEYQFTQAMTDPLSCASFVGISCDQDYSMINDRFYIRNSVIDFSEVFFECYFSSRDSLHYYILFPPTYRNESIIDIARLGEDRILRLYLDSFDGEVHAYMNYSPFEFNPVYTHEVSLGYNIPTLNNMYDNILMITIRREGSIFISALCTVDFPISHNFSFPAPPYLTTLPGYTFTHENKLFHVSGGVIYTFTVDYTLPNADEAVSPQILSLSAYPNPVNRRDGITFQASTNKPLEVDIYNIRGQKVKTVCLRSDGSTQWDLRNDKGESVSAGVYFAQPRQEQDSKPIKFVVIH